MKNLSKKVIFSLLLVISAVGLYSLFVKEIRKNNQQIIYNNHLNNYNIIMISINNIGTQHMSLYGYRRKTTPYLDRLAHKAFIFENVFSPASWTLPAITSIFTSLYPYTHKVMDRYRENMLDKNIKTLPEILKENNYKTAAFTGGLDNLKTFGHMRGFETTDTNPPFTGFEVTFTQAKKWLSQNSDRKFFLFIHGYNAHPPFTPPQRFTGIFSDPRGRNISVNHNITLRGYRNEENKYVAYYIPRSKSEEKQINTYPSKQTVNLNQDDIDYLRDLYDEEVLSVDSMVGSFLNSLSKDTLNKTMVIIFSEHGEMFAKHGRFGRAGAIRGTLYDDVMHVPLIMKIPRQKGRRIKGLIQVIDIMPTVLEILDIPSPQTMQGKSLMSLIKDGAPVNEFVYAGAIYNANRLSPNQFYKFQSTNESIRSLQWKLIHEVILPEPNNTAKKARTETFELYNLKDDPEEIMNVIDAYPDITRQLKEKLNQWSKCSREPMLFHTSTYGPAKELIDDAREHGYW